MTGYNYVLEVELLRRTCDQFGMRWGHSKFHIRDYDVVALFPKDNALPMFARDAEIFVGTIEELKVWLRGLEWARNYDRMLFGNSIESKRARKEEDQRNKIVMDILKK